MTRVYKYALPLPYHDWTTVAMPVNAQVLTVQMQNGLPHLWARVSDGAPMEGRRFRWAGTGSDLDERETGRYIATWQDGPYVWHLFEEPGR